MENASKALLIAGGILLALLTISLLVYLSISITSFGDAQDAKTLVKQITAFNKEYEAYNRRELYGADVITVVNKAINHNDKMQLNGKCEEEEPYYINIIFKTKGSFCGTIRTRTYNEDGYEEECYDAPDSVVLNEDETYKLGNYDGETSFKIDENLRKFFKQQSAIEVSNEKDEATREYYFYYYYIPSYI